MYDASVVRDDTRHDGAIAICRHADFAAAQRFVQRQLAAAGPPNANAHAIASVYARESSVVARREL